MICDLAQTYQIYDWRSVPGPLLVTLVSGLGEDSRIGRLRDGRRASLGTYFLAELCDMLEVLILGLAGKEGSPNRAGLLVTKQGAGSSSGYTREEYDQLRARIMKEG